MRIFDSHSALRDLLGAEKRWSRTLEALAAAPSLTEGVTYSIGDSLTYRTGSAADLAARELTGRRRYLMVVASLAGEVAVEVARQEDLAAVAPYSDLTDRQPFTGPAERVLVPDGGLLIVDIDEAARILPTPDARAVLLHVTVEGASFHNK